MKKMLVMMLAIGTLVACKKDAGEQPGTPSYFSDKVKKTTHAGGGTTFLYDGSGRIISRVYLNGKKTEFEYQAGKVIERQYDAAGVLRMSYTYELNASGLVDKELCSDQPAFFALRTYNSDKQAVQFSAIQNGSTNSADYFFSKGNCDSSRHSSNGNWNSTIKYTYYEDKLNVLDNAQYGQYFWGKKSKNLMKSEQYFFSDGSVGGLESYSYEFDAKGRVIKWTTVADANIDITYYSYE